jgi:hypothetical protein
MSATADVEVSDSRVFFVTGEGVEDSLNLASGDYEVTAQPDSFTAPTGVAKTEASATKAAMRQLSKQVVKAQRRPGTTRLSGGTSGAPVTITTGNNGDQHVTFFRWGTKQQVASAFLKSGGSLTISVPPGTYRLVYAEGDIWYGPKYSFGPTGEYEEFKAKSSSRAPMRVVIRYGYSYTVSIEVASTDGSGGLPSGTINNPFAK